VKHASLLPAVDGVLAEALLRFMEYHPAARVTCNLRKMTFEFLMSEAAIENIYLKDLLYDLDGLFDLLDEIQAHEKE
jgi:hypothetical protein